MTQSQVKDIGREQLEKDLNFAGFVIISCPLKQDSKAVVKEIIGASHHVAMITGDNPLTACHVARELKFTRSKTTLILSAAASGKENEEDEEGSWEWRSVDEATTVALPESEGKKFNEFRLKYDLCLTGEGLSHLHDRSPKFFRQILPHVRVFARVAPKQKELVITGLREMGYNTLMCGDGTNDVGALKHANVGVAILSSMPEKPDKKKKASSEDGASEKDQRLAKLSKQGKIAKRPGQQQQESKASRQQQQLQKMLKELEEADQAQVVKLGDASVAAPFTAKLSSIACVNHIIKQGRCTLVTTLQMFKILALNALILAYSQSVLYLEGVKFSDGQATLQGLLLAACFLFISRSKPLKTLSKQRPLPNIFNLYTISTVLLQFAVHFGCLIFLVQEAYKREPK